MEKDPQCSLVNDFKPAGQEVRGIPGGQVKREQMVNALNRINFSCGQVFVTMKHCRFASYINVAAIPQPCRGDNLDLVWSDLDAGNARRLTDYEYQEFFYSDGLRKVLVKAPLREAGPAGLSLTLPEAGHDVSRRLQRRFGCHPTIGVQISQNGLVLSGRLADFNGQGFAVDLSGTPEHALRLVNSEHTAHVVLRDDDEVLFAEPCRIVRLVTDPRVALTVLRPCANRITRFPSKEVRSVRQHLLPQPCIEFDHPLFARKVSLRTVDISGSGVAVEEESSHSLLMPGMVIPRAALVFANRFRIDCRAQVLFNLAGPDPTSRRCGLAFLDMAADGQMQLSSILYQARNPHSFVGGNVDLDALWDFFFETGFIYPKKYDSIQEQRQKFKELYSRLYNDHPEISRHILYQDRNVIHGHVSMFRYYDQTWMLHHHAAMKSSQHKAGLVVMDHILQHINEVHNLASTRMRYIACYFRPNNRFAARVFGGSARALANPRKCSLDDFAYGHYQARAAGPGLPAGWRLSQSTPEDFTILQYAYREKSGGLLLEGLDLYPGGLAHEAEINEHYQMLGFRRERFFFSLRHPDGGLVAMWVVNISDVGLNMSDLVNGVQIMVIEEAEMSVELLAAGLDELAAYYEGAELSTLLYPLACAERQGLPYEKIYQLIVLDLNFISEYLTFIEGLTGSSSRPTS